MDKRGLSERGICTKFITPALRQAGWDEMLQVREEVSSTTFELNIIGCVTKLPHESKATSAVHLEMQRVN